MTVSAFGVEHGAQLIHKAQTQKPSAKRTFLAGAAPGLHGAVAGKQGKKVRAFGNEVAGGMAGTVAGGVAGGLVRSPRLAQVAATAGMAGGGIAGMRRASRKGYLKREQ